MFWKGRTFFSHLAVSLLLASPSWSFADSFDDCFKPILDSAIGKSLPPEIANYNRLSQRSLDPQSIHQGIEDSMNELKKIAPQLPKDEFLAWYRKHPYTADEIAKLSTQKKTLGEALHAKTEAFAKTLNSSEFQAATRDLNDALEQLRKICGEDVDCHTQGIAKVMSKNERKLFDCLRHDKDTLQSIITGFAVSNAGIVASQIGKEDANLKNFPYEIVLNNVLWTPIIGEMACKNKARAELATAGQTASVKPRGFMTHVKNAGLSYWNYMKLSPFNEASYMAFHITAEKARGTHKEKTWAELGDEFVMYMKWDVQYAVPRSIFVLDPLYNKWLPKLKPGMNHTLGPAIGKGGYVVIDGGLRVATGALNTRLFQEYEKQKSFGFVADWISGKNSTSVPVSAPPKVKLNCAQLEQVYQDCMRKEILAADVVNLNSTSKKGTETLEACREKLDAYEAQCGAFFAQ